MQSDGAFSLESVSDFDEYVLENGSESGTGSCRSAA